MRNTTKSKHSGRTPSSDDVRELVNLIGALHEQGDSISIDAIAARLGVSTKEAHSMMDIICQASGEETGGLLISCNDDETEFTLQYPGIHGRPVRLTPSETMALMHGLDVTGVPTDSALRRRVEKAFASTSVDSDKVRQTLGTSSMDSNLIACAQSQMQQRAVTFMYLGVRDKFPRERCAVVRSLTPHGTTWLVEAYDTGLGENRTFRFDRMSKLALGNPVVLQDDSISKKEPTRLVELEILDETYLTMYDWPHLSIIRQEPAVIHATIPYYGEGSTWLIRRLAACNTQVIAKDPNIMEAVRQYAASQLVG